MLEERLGKSLLLAATAGLGNTATAAAAAAPALLSRGARAGGGSAVAAAARRWDLSRRVAMARKAYEALHPMLELEQQLEPLANVRANTVPLQHHGSTKSRSVMSRQ